MAYLDDIPKMAFGTAGYEIGLAEGRTSHQEFISLLRRAVQLGCRHIDCAPLYGTQALVGEVLEEMLISMPRSEFFITSKLPPNMMQEQNIEKSIVKTLADLKISHLDLYLIHAPFATRHVGDNIAYPLDMHGNLLLDETENLLENAWLKLKNLKDRGLVRYIGLSNVNHEQMIRINQLHHIDVIQNEYHLYNQDRDLVDECEELDIHFEAFAAMGCPPRAEMMNMPTFLTDPVVARIARDYRIPMSQVILRWLHQQPLSFVIKSDFIEQVEENYNFPRKVTLSMTDMIDLDTLNKNMRLFSYDEYHGIRRHREYPFRPKIIQEPAPDYRSNYYIRQ